VSIPLSSIATILTSCRYDLRATFDILVGKSPSPVERFTVHTAVLTQRSRFLCAARKPQWLTDVAKPVDLTDEDPEVFQAYLNCVYFGPQTLCEHVNEFERQTERFNTVICVCTLDAVSASSLLPVVEHFGRIKSIQLDSMPDVFVRSMYHIEFADIEDVAGAIAGLNGYELDGTTLCVFISSSRSTSTNAREAINRLSDAGSKALIKLYLLADKLQDLTTANMVMDELMDFVAKAAQIPRYTPTSLAYNSTAGSNPLRALLRDYWIYQMPNDGADLLKANNFPKDFLRDVAAEFMLLRLGKATTQDRKRDKCPEKCLYHQHDDEHPLCGGE
jgi:hypothetical protein